MHWGTNRGKCDMTPPTPNIISHPLSNDAREARVLVLMYHRVGPSDNAWELRYCISPELFAKHLHAIESQGYRPISARTMFEWLEGGALPSPRSVVITFDDGFQELHTHAAPLLAARGWPYTVFLVADLIGKEDAWTQQENPAGRCHRLLDAREISDMMQMGASFQSHSLRHSSLVALDDAALHDDLVKSRCVLEDLLGHPVEFLAYPFGHVDARVQAAACTAGYRGAFSTQPGFNRASVDRYRIRRLDIAGDDGPGTLIRKMRFGTNDGGIFRSAKYYLSRLRGR